MKINKNTKKIKVTENDFKDFSKIATIPEHLEKSMVLYIRTWQEVPDDNQQENTMTTKPEWFNEFENKQNEFNKRVVEFMSDQDKRWKEQQEFNQKVVKRLDNQDKLIQQILSLVQSLVKRINNLVVKNNLKE